MNREILFRGKLNSGEWAYGNLEITKDKIYIITPDDTIIGKYGQVDPDTVGQYTGSDDKNGTKIFEGDFFTDGKIIWIAEYGINGFHARSKMNSHIIFSLYHIARRHNEGREIEIIGNIHDNGEKQVAKKCVIKGDYWTCPNCGIELSELDFDKNGMVIPHYRIRCKYCQDCGQRLKFEE